MDVRKTTNRLIELAEDGVISWEDIARTALNWLSEDDVHRMAEVNEFLPDEDEEDITYKYEKGDVVMFNNYLAGKSGKIARISGLAAAYNNEPHYYLEGDIAIYPESCFAGRYEECD